LSSCVAWPGNERRGDRDGRQDEVVRDEDVRAKFGEVAALWAVGRRNAADVVMAACDALVAGVDSPSLAVLAGVPLRGGEYEVREVLPAALRELGLPAYSENDLPTDVAVLGILAAQVVDGSLPPYELAAWASHDYEVQDAVPAAQELARLYDEYDYVGYTSVTGDEIDTRIVELAGRIAGHPSDPSMQG
jgi:hypothetical protein